MPGAATAHILLSLLSAAAVAARGGDSGRAGTAGAATRTERCAAQRTTSRTGVRDATAPLAGLPESDPAACDDARDCSLEQAATDDRDRHIRCECRNRHLCGDITDARRRSTRRTAYGGNSGLGANAGSPTGGSTNREARARAHRRAGTNHQRPHLRSRRVPRSSRRRQPEGK